MQPTTDSHVPILTKFGLLNLVHDKADKPTKQCDDDVLMDWQPPSRLKSSRCMRTPR